MPTFAAVLKYGTLPLAGVLAVLPAFGRREIDCPVEIEAAVDLAIDPTEEARLVVLQIGPGRCGSADRRRGIPLSWDGMNRKRIETPCLTFPCPA